MRDKTTFNESRKRNDMERHVRLVWPARLWFIMSCKNRKKRVRHFEMLNLMYFYSISLLRFHKGLKKNNKTDVDNKLEKIPHSFQVLREQ